MDGNLLAAVTRSTYGSELTPRWGCCVLLFAAGATGDNDGPHCLVSGTEGCLTGHHVKSQSHPSPMTDATNAEIKLPYVTEELANGFGSIMA